MRGKTHWKIGACTYLVSTLPITLTYAANHPDSLSMTNPFITLPCIACAAIGGLFPDIDTESSLVNKHNLVMKLSPFIGLLTILIPVALFIVSFLSLLSITGAFNIPSSIGFTHTSLLIRFANFIYTNEIVAIIAFFSSIAIMISIHKERLKTKSPILYLVILIMTISVFLISMASTLGEPLNIPDGKISYTPRLLNAILHQKILALVMLILSPFSIFLLKKFNLGVFNKNFLSHSLKISYFSIAILTVIFTWFDIKMFFVAVFIASIPFLSHREFSHSTEGMICYCLSFTFITQKLGHSYVGLAFTIGYFSHIWLADFFTTQGVYISFIVKYLGEKYVSVRNSSVYTFLAARKSLNVMTMYTASGNRFELIYSLVLFAAAVISIRSMSKFTFLFDK